MDRYKLGNYYNILLLSNYNIIPNEKSFVTKSVKQRKNVHSDHCLVRVKFRARITYVLYATHRILRITVS